MICINNHLDMEDTMVFSSFFFIVNYWKQSTVLFLLSVAIFSMWKPRYLKNLWTLTFLSSMKMLHLSAPGWRCIKALNAYRQTKPTQFILRQILLTYILKIVSLSPSSEYCRKPRSTYTLNFVWSMMRTQTKFLPHCPAQQLGTFLIGVMILSTDRFQKIPLNLEILPETKSLPSDSSYFLKLLNSGSAFITQLASLSLLIISRYLSKTGSVISKFLKIILSWSGLMKISPISRSSTFTELLGGYWTECDLSSFVATFSFKGGFAFLEATDCFLLMLFLLGLLAILGWERLRFKFLLLADFDRLRLDWDLISDWFSVALFFSLSRLVLGTFFLDCLGFSLPLDLWGLRLRLRLLLALGDLFLSTGF